MRCERHLFGMRWQHHAWRRRVIAAEDVPMPATSQWGLPVVERQTLCHVEYRCERCGAVRDGGACGCDTARGDRCPARLAWLEREAQERRS